MPNFKAEYTLEMVLDLIEADLKSEGFDLAAAPINFNLVDFNRATLQLDIVKADRNAIPSFLDTLNYPQEAKQALLGPASAPATQEPAPAPAPTGAKPSKRTGNPPDEAELARRAKISAHMKKQRADERAARAAQKAAILEAGQEVIEVTQVTSDQLLSLLTGEPAALTTPPEPEPVPEMEPDIHFGALSVPPYTELPAFLNAELKPPKSKYAAGKKEPSERELARRIKVGEGNRARAKERADERARIEADQKNALQIIARVNSSGYTPETTEKRQYNKVSPAERQLAFEQKLAEQETKKEVVAPTTPTFPARKPAEQLSPTW
jgi:hypothetical protein